MRNLSDAFYEHEARERDRIERATWGHLAPNPRKVYHGTMIFAMTEWGEEVLISADFPDLEDSPWSHEDMREFVRDHAIKAGQVYRFIGNYKRTSKGAFWTGTTSEVNVGY